MRLQSNMNALRRYLRTSVTMACIRIIKFIIERTIYHFDEYQVNNPLHPMRKYHRLENQHLFFALNKDYTMNEMNYSLYLNDYFQNGQIEVFYQ